MTELVLVVSLALNVAAGAVLLYQRARHARSARLACAECPFVPPKVSVLKTVAIPVIDEPTTMFRGP